MDNVITVARMMRDVDRARGLPHKVQTLLGHLERVENSEEYTKQDLTTVFRRFRDLVAETLPVQRSDVRRKGSLATKWLEAIDPNAVFELAKLLLPAASTVLGSRPRRRSAQPAPPKTKRAARSNTQGRAARRAR